MKKKVYGEITLTQPSKLITVKELLVNSRNNMDIINNWNHYNKCYLDIEEYVNGKKVSVWGKRTFKTLSDMIVFLNQSVQKNGEFSKSRTVAKVYDVVSQDIPNVTEVSSFNTFWSLIKGKGNSNNTKQKTLRKAQEIKWGDYSSWMEEVLAKVVQMRGYAYNASDEPEKVFWIPRNRKSMYKAPKSDAIELESPAPRKVYSLEHGIKDAGMDDYTLKETFFYSINIDSQVFYEKTSPVLNVNESVISCTKLENDKGDTAVFIKPVKKDKVRVGKFDDDKYQLYVSCETNKPMIRKIEIGKMKSNGILINKSSVLFNRAKEAKFFLRDIKTGYVSDLSSVSIKLNTLN